MNLGERIRFYRKENSLTQQALAKKANISRSYLADVEKNRYNPSLETLDKIIMALGLTKTEFFKDDDNERLYDSIFEINKIADKALNEKKESSHDQIEKIVRDNGIRSLAAHFEGEEFTEEDVEDIKDFIQFVLSKKKNK